MADDLPKKIPNLMEKVKICILENKYRLTDHAVERQTSRRIILPVIRHILLKGEHYPLEDRFRLQFNRWSYAIVGKNLEGDEIKIIVAFDEKEELMFIITVMYVKKKEV